MQSILIVEDDIEQLDFIKKTTMGFNSDWKIVTASTYSGAITYIDNSINNNSPFSFFMLDVMLSHDDNDRSGYDIAGHIRKYPAYRRSDILFLTSVPDYSNEALLKYHYYSYIGKPFTKEILLNQLEQLSLSYIINQCCIQITDTSKIVHNVDTSDILFVRTAKPHVLFIQLTDGSLHSRQYRLEKLLEILGQEFIKIHRSTFINKHHISRIDMSNQVIHVGNHVLHIGRNYIEIVRKLIQ